MSRGRRRRKELEAAAPASTVALWVLVVNGFFGLLCAAALGGFVHLIAIGWWSTVPELVLAAVLILAAAVAVLFCVDGIRRDLRSAGWSARGELVALGRRFRSQSARPHGSEKFASQRFTGKARRRR